MQQQDVHAYLFHLLGSLSRRFHRPDPESALSPSEMAVLWTLSHATAEAPYPSQISRIMGIQRPSLTPLLRTLEAKGLIERQPDPVDRRRCRIALTSSCRDAQWHMGRRQLDRFHRLLDQALLPDELEMLANLLRRLEAAAPSFDGQEAVQ